MMMISRSWSAQDDIVVGWSPSVCEQSGNVPKEVTQPGWPALPLPQQAHDHSHAIRLQDGPQHLHVLRQPPEALHHMPSPPGRQHIHVHPCIHPDLRQSDCNSKPFGAS